MFGVAQEGDLATVLILPLRGGRLGERFTFVVENAAASSPDELVLLAADERYGGPSGVGAAAGRACRPSSRRAR